MTSTSHGSKDDDERGLGKRSFSLNPEVIRGAPPLPDLDHVEVVIVQSASHWARWSEGILIHVAGSGLMMILAFIAGLMLGQR